MRKIILLAMLFWTIPAFAQRFSDNSDYTFAVKFLKTGFEMKKDNFVVSPLSVYFATTLLANGAEGETLQELSSILSAQNQHNFDIQKTNEIVKNYMKQKSSQVEINNSIWGNQFLQDYTDFVQQELSAEPKKLPSSTSEINKWVEEKTKGKIKDILPVKTPDNTALFLVNTIYFKDEWHNKLSFLEEQKFQSLDGRTDKVNMVGTQTVLNYYEDNLIQAVKLPYKNSDVMQILLPKKNIDFNQFIKNLTPQYLSSIKYKGDLVRLRIPRFDIGIKINGMISFYKKWGIKSAFEPRADFPKMSNISHYVDSIIHATNISIDEDGSEASAATVINMMLSSPGPGNVKKEKPIEPKIFTADRPFVFMINNGLFIGTYTKGSLVAKRGSQEVTEQNHPQKPSTNKYVRPRKPASVTYNRSPAYNNKNQTRGGVSHIKRN
ncbi:MAG: hypothetical protein J6T72_04970 [Alphaproteobacteria bacterium]|nr:hypothetical protein [Alphaproteobacteria bacterium]